tara:strand:- start:1779 stop:2486 length:708 start_codon:yes stop_codon:yes gene_type:complete
MDEKKIKQFWESRGQKLHNIAFESLANLEEDPENLEIKMRDEQAKVFSWFDPYNKTILDLGAGVGQWAFRFHDRGAIKVDAVEYSKSFVDIGRNEAKRRNAMSIEFFHADAQGFNIINRYDIIFISGLFVYLGDKNANQVLQNISNGLAPQGKVIVRDGTAVNSAYELDNIYSEHLDEYYSATYRTLTKYKELFSQAGFQCLRNENMFTEGHVLNKYEETRLHLFELTRTGSADS